MPTGLYWALWGTLMGLWAIFFARSLFLTSKARKLNRSAWYSQAIAVLLKARKWNRAAMFVVTAAVGLSVGQFVQGMLH